VRYVHAAVFRLVKRDAHGERTERQTDRQSSQNYSDSSCYDPKCDPENIQLADLHIPAHTMELFSSSMSLSRARYTASRHHP
jgi:hypothetical protein